MFSQSEECPGEVRQQEEEVVAHLPGEQAGGKRTAATKATVPRLAQCHQSAQAFPEMETFSRSVRSGRSLTR